MTAESRPRRLWSGGVGPTRGEVWAHGAADGVHAAIKGSLCVVNARGVADALDELADGVDGRLSLDLSGVTYCDVHGARTVMDVRRHCDDVDVEIVLTDPSGPVVRIFDRGGFSRCFDVNGGTARWVPHGRLSGAGPGARHDEGDSRDR